MRTENELVDFKSAQEYLDISRSTLLRWIKNRKIKAYKTGKKWKFYQQDLNHFVLKESESEYLYAPNIKKILAQIGVGEISQLESNDQIWSNWQDQSGWLWLSCIINPQGAKFIVKYNHTECYDISLKDSKIITSNWQRWCNDNQKRPAHLEHLAGSGQQEQYTLFMSRDIRKLEPSDKSVFSQLIKDIKSSHDRQFIIEGPVARITAEYAYLISQALVEKDDMIVSQEQNYSVFWPAAIQTYEDQDSNKIAADLQLLQLMRPEFEAQNLYRPKYKIGYFLSPKYEHKDKYDIKLEGNIIKIH